MQTPIKHSIITWRGTTARLFPAPAVGYVYLIHFKCCYKHACHYLGFTTNLEARLALHRSGNGARLMEVISEAGIEWEVVRLWPVNSSQEGLALERRLKKQHSPKLCPRCNPRRAPDALVLLREGKRPFGWLSRPRRRVSMNEPRPRFIRRAFGSEVAR